jgi:putative serine protease PepD
LAVAAVLGAVVTVVALAGAGVLEGGAGPVTPAGVVTAVSVGGDDDSIAELVASSGASVVAVRVTGLDPAAPPITASGVALGRREVLTGAGVVAGAVTVTVATDGRVLDAEVVGVDADTDVALLRVREGDLPPARLGEADELSVGQSVFGLGIAGGDHRWVGRGIVSSLDRMVPTMTGGVLAGLVETDLRPGTAVPGGALLDASGAVVGILSGAAPGRAVPIEWARDVADQLATNGVARHGVLGVQAVDAGDRPGGGARVTGVLPGGPAEVAGLHSADVVTAVGGERITDVADLVAAVARRRPGDPVVVVLWRGEDRRRVEANLGDRALTPAAMGHA